MQPIRSLAVLAKAFILFAIANAMFAIFQPPVEKLSLYNSVFPGRTRFPHGSGKADLDLSAENIDAMFAAHIIAQKPKPSDEVRVVVLGDSSIYGLAIPLESTLPEVLNKANLICANKRLRFYNLSYPMPVALKDLVTLEKAKEYEPDGVLWFVTLNTFRLDQKHPLVLANLEYTQSLLEKYPTHYALPTQEEKSFELLQKSMIGNRHLLARIIKGQMFGFYWQANIDHPQEAEEETNPSPANAPENIAYNGLKPPKRLEEHAPFTLLDAGYAIAGDIPILLVNEPIQSSNRFGDDFYNYAYPRWAYDEFREIMNARAKKNGWKYVDLWDALPYGMFDEPLHPSPQGISDMAEGLIPHITQALCPSTQ
jgi:hypothetical protein